MVGDEFEPLELLELVLGDRVFYDDSRGGVTFSGGEPLAQPEFLREILQLCRSCGLHTAVDTCGMARQEHLLAVAELTDLFLFDLKFINDARHQRYTGVSNELILENLRVLSRKHNRIWLRIPLIPGINNQEADLKAAAEFAETLPAVRQVNILPFHKTGTTKLAQTGRMNLSEKLTPPTANELNTALDIFRSAGLTAVLGG